MSTWNEVQPSIRSLVRRHDSLRQASSEKYGEETWSGQIKEDRQSNQHRHWKVAVVQTGWRSFNIRVAKINDNTPEWVGWVSCQYQHVGQYYQTRIVTAYYRGGYALLAREGIVGIIRVEFHFWGNSSFEELDIFGGVLLCWKTAHSRDGISHPSVIHMRPR